MTGTAGPLSTPPHTDIARALGDPTRAAIHDLIRDSSEPVTIAQITERLQLNHNGIRRHLGKLRDAGLILENREIPTGRGRPGLIYTAAPGPEGHSPTEPHTELARLLLRMITTGQDPLTVGREAGRRIATELRPEDTGTGPTRGGRSTPDELATALAAAARRMGFDPKPHTSGKSTEILLRRCPFAAEVEFSPEIICLLHRGIAEGIGDVLRPGATIRLALADPRRGGCRISM
ncbi:helix-turn-helix transcriptional regulator [Austwickia chelonae]|nr:helix-turn-helix domain-containing protein [Austwickia chelonae]